MTTFDMGDIMQDLSTAVREARQDRDAERRDRLARENRRFTQVYPKGWARLQRLIQTHPSAARLYALLAEHLDPEGGVVVASQSVLAEMLGVTDRTIRTLTKTLEDQSALVRIRVSAGTYAYALDPAEIWKAWDAGKDFAVFRTKTLVSKGGQNARVERRIRTLMSADQPELDLGDNETSRS